MAAKTKANYAFIDSQNLNLGVCLLGWKLDHKKLRLCIDEEGKLEYHQNKKPTRAVGRNLRQSRRKSNDRRSVETLGLQRNGDSPVNIAKNGRKSKRASK